jgi:hypothetical protein
VPVAAFEPDPLGGGRRVTGSFRFFPLPGTLARGLATAGEHVPPEFLDADDRPPLLEPVP